MRPSPATLGLAVLSALLVAATACRLPAVLTLDQRSGSETGVVAPVPISGGSDSNGAGASHPLQAAAQPAADRSPAALPAAAGLQSLYMGFGAVAAGVATLAEAYVGARLNGMAGSNTDSSNDIGGGFSGQDVGANGPAQDPELTQLYDAQMRLSGDSKLRYELYDDVATMDGDVLDGRTADDLSLLLAAQLLAREGARGVGGDGSSAATADRAETQVPPADGGVHVPTTAADVSVDSDVYLDSMGVAYDISYEEENADEAGQDASSTDADSSNATNSAAAVDGLDSDQYDSGLLDAATFIVSDAVYDTPYYQFYNAYAEEDDPGVAGETVEDILAEIAAVGAGGNVEEAYDHDGADGSGGLQLLAAAASDDAASGVNDQDVLPGDEAAFPFRAVADDADGSNGLVVLSRRLLSSGPDRDDRDKPGPRRGPGPGPDRRDGPKPADLPAQVWVPGIVRVSNDGDGNVKVRVGPLGSIATINSQAPDAKPSPGPLASALGGGSVVDAITDRAAAGAVAGDRGAAVKALSDAAAATATVVADASRAASAATSSSNADTLGAFRASSGLVSTFSPTEDASQAMQLSSTDGPSGSGKSEPENKEKPKVYVGVGPFGSGVRVVSDGEGSTVTRIGPMAGGVRVATAK